jgi:hypothetical protein
LLDSDVIWTSEDERAHGFASRPISRSTSGFAGDSSLCRHTFLLGSIYLWPISKSVIQVTLQRAR